MPTWCSTRRGSNWSSISIAATPAASDMRDGAVDVDRIAPAAAGVEHHRQLADRADVDHDLIISVSERSASVTPLSQPSEPPER